MIRNLITKAISLFEQIPYDLIALLARLGIGTVFLRSGLLKIDGFTFENAFSYLADVNKWANGNTVALFRDEYKLPILPPELAAYMGTMMELAMPMLLFAGLFTRFAAFALLGMTLTIQIFVYPNAFDTHAVWAVCFLVLMKYGAGRFSLDYAVKQKMGGSNR
jgi:putative oxidoreductase